MKLTGLLIALLVVCQLLFNIWTVGKFAEVWERLTKGPSR